MHMLARAFALLALVSGAFAPALAQQGSKGSKTSVEIKRQGTITSILIVDREIAQQMKRLEAIRRRPAEDTRAIVRWIKAKRDRLPPPYLYELARRTFGANRDEGMMWFALATVRARYDAMRCRDRSARGGIRYLPAMALEVWQHARGNRADYGLAGTRALKLKPLFARSRSPWWLCVKGAGVASRVLSGKKVDRSRWIEPKKAWPEIEATLKRDYARFFEEQGRPQVDPVPMTTGTFPVETPAPEANVSKYAWLDGRRLVYSREERAAPSRNRAHSIVLRERGEAERKLGAVRIPRDWCAGDGKVYRYVRPEKASTGKDKPKAPAAYFYGSPNRLRRHAAPVGLHRVHAEIIQGRGYGGGVNPKGNTRKQSGIDCRIAESALMVEKFQPSHAAPLRPGDGWLGFCGRHSWTKNGSSCVFHKPKGSNRLVDLVIQMPGLAPKCVRYYGFKGAYFLSVCAGDRTVRRRLAAGKCVPVWWFRPNARPSTTDAGKAKRLERVCLTPDAHTGEAVRYEPSRVGILRIVTHRSTYHGKKAGGIYLTRPGGKHEKLHTGHVTDARVSPDGCRIAFREVASPVRYDRYSLRVMHLCGGVSVRK